MYKTLLTKHVETLEMVESESLKREEQSSEKKNIVESWGIREVAGL